MTKTHLSRNFRQRSFQAGRAARWLAGSFASICFASSANALIISDDVFTRNGGSFSNVPGTIAKAMAPLQEASYSPQFLAVGAIGGCTATWLGDTPDGASSVFLLAAHCVEEVVGGKITIGFSDWSGKMSAGGAGKFVLGPYRQTIPSGMGGASTDIALVTLPRVAPIFDKAGVAIPQPVLYDGSDELNEPVWFAGYGLWGTGTTGPNQAYAMDSTMRRAAAASQVTSIFESDFGIGASFNPKVAGDFGTRVASGDSGSAWWQQQDGQWVIVATTNGQGDMSSTGARVSKYVDWIRSIYPQARFSSDGYTVTAQQGVTTPNFALDAKVGTVAYVVPVQPKAIGPQSMIWAGNFKPSIIQVLGEEQTSHREGIINLKGQRDIGCGTGYFQEMNDAVSCYSNRSGPLVITYDPKDNPGLAPGTYLGSFKVVARGWHDTSYVRTIPMKINIVVK